MVDEAPDLGSAATVIGRPHGEPAVKLGRGGTIGRFVLVDELGEGGMGVVYAAYDPQLDRKVAIKLLHAALHSPEYHARLLREAQAMAKINHPNVVKVHEAGAFEGQVYVAMEFCDGGTLRAWLTAAPRSQREILDVFAQAGQGLAAAHDAGLVHRDFKPHNVLMAGDGVVRVSDFGLASLVGDAPREPPPALDAASGDAPSGSTPLSWRLTQTGAIMGTPTYMAPEQFAGRATSAATDQFAYCVALYEALYGELPFPHATTGDLAYAVQHGVYAKPPASARVPKWLRAAVMRGLSVAEADRFPSMRELLHALARDPRRRNRRIAAGAAAAVVAIAGLFVLRPARVAECSGGHARREAVWGPARAAALE
ncbi:MAG TPA: serine/threonine-protein kinase, partial [Kofleriaceae bacterium]|nr:serine/threonine-protein kinase [Kofleriaceae bacterium]